MEFKGLEDNKEESFKSGFVSLAGRPNVGKSTLINAFLGQRIAAVSPRPQTTRHQQLGILTLNHAQIIFMDTPGIHQPRHLLGQWMNQEAKHAMDEGDVILWVVDGQVPPTNEDHMLADIINKMNRPIPILIGMNKVDRISETERMTRLTDYDSLIPAAETFLISAVTRENLDELLDTIIEHLPESPPYYPEDQVTDAYERDIAADLIRAAALRHLQDEIPHSLAIRIDEFKERDEHGAYIAATIFVERESQKPIVIGRSGRMIKRIGSSARHEIEAMGGRKVFLDLRVKVRKGWRNNKAVLQSLGFQWRQKK
jgi:GTP-binding protein Era